MEKYWQKGETDNNKQMERIRRIRRTKSWWVTGLWGTPQMVRVPF